MSILLPDSLSRVREAIRERLGVAWCHYEADLDILLHLRWLGLEPKCIYDIGASNTVWSVMANAVFPAARMELFEPLAEISPAYHTGKYGHPAICSFLENADHRIHAIALGQKSGACEFQHFENDSASTSLELEYHDPTAQTVTVPMYRLDDYVDQEKLPPPDLLKLDTQGSEMDILKGGLKCVKNAKSVFLEGWLTRGYGRHTPLFLEMANLLSEAGFDLFAIGDEYRDAKGIAQTKDTVFVQRSVIFAPEILLPQKANQLMNMTERLRSAKQEIADEFGPLYCDYAYDLVLLRILSEEGFSPRVIYDVGGSDGIWSAVAAKVFPEARYEVFEPLAETSEEYVESLKKSSYSKELFSTGRARMHAVALGENNGRAHMTVYPSAVGSTSIKLDYEPADAKLVEVPQWRLDDYMAAHNLEQPDLLKLDTQGAEMEILRGGTKALANVSAVLCECWFFKGYGSHTPLWLEVANCLAGHSLNIYDMGWEYRNPSDQRTATKDILFLKGSLPFSPLREYESTEASETVVVGEEEQILPPQEEPSPPSSSWFQRLLGRS